MDLQHYLLLSCRRPISLLPRLQRPLQKKQTKNIKTKQIQSTSKNLYRLTSNDILKGQISSKVPKQETLRRTSFLPPQIQHEAEKKNNVIGNYSIGKQLGKGGFAKVYEATHTLTLQKYAIKEYLLEDSYQCFMNECNVGKVCIKQSQLTPQIPGHQNLIRFIDRIRVGKKGYIIQEIGGTNLSKMLYDIQGVFHQNQRVYEIVFKEFYRDLIQHNKLKSLFLQICNATSILNSKGYIHCDLKSENILISTSESHQSLAKVIDFGSTFQLSKGLPKITITPEYMPPQLLTLLSQDSNEEVEKLDKVDVWSLGCILLEIITGIPLWFKYKCKLMIKGKVHLQLGYFSLSNRDYNKIIKKQRQMTANLNRIPFVFQQFEKFRPILKKCLEFDYNQRISIEKLVQEVQNL